MRQSQQDRVSTSGQGALEPRVAPSTVNSDDETGQRTFTTERFKRPPVDDSARTKDNEHQSNKGLYAIIVVMSIVIVVLGCVIFWLTSVQGSVTSDQATASTDSPTTLADSHASSDE